MESKVENVFLGELFHSQDKGVIPLLNIMNPIKTELQNLLERGISIKINDVEITILFKLVLIIGDNLGLNSVHGLVESFSGTFFCRF